MLDNLGRSVKQGNKPALIRSTISNVLHSLGGKQCKKSKTSLPGLDTRISLLMSPYNGQRAYVLAQTVMLSCPHFCRLIG